MSERTISTAALAPGPLAGRVALVTGGTRSIGAAISRRLLADGATVVAVHRRDGDAADAFSASLGPDDAARFTVLRADIGEPAECRRIVADTVERHGRIDHLVSNAAAMRDSRFREMTAEQWDEVVGVGLTSVFHLVQAAVGPMQEAGYGRIVLVSSISAEKGSMWQANYAAAKAGLVGLARSVAREHGRDGITVNIVLPGPTADSDMNALTPPDVTERLRRLIPLKRLALADDTAHAVAFLLDERSAYLTGVVLPVDGGFSL